MDDPPRFLDPPWVLSDVPRIRTDSILHAPAAFIRHGALPDPKDLDAGGGARGMNGSLDRDALGFPPGPPAVRHVIILE